MGIDESGHQSHARQIDYLRIRRGLNFAHPSHRFDFLAAHQHRPTIMQLSRLAIKDVRRSEQINRLLWSRRLGLRRGDYPGEEASDNKNYEKQQCVTHFD